MGAKLVTVLPGNTVRGLPSHQASIVLFDAASGALLGVTDGRYITEARTAAVSAVSARHMARADADVLAIIGSGVQAHSHLEALPLVRDFREIRVWSPNAAHLAQFAAGRDVKIADSAECAVRGADVVVLATSSTTPVIEDGWVDPGTHVVAVGACRPTHRETDPRLVAHSLLVVDSRAAAMKEAGDILLAIEEGLIGSGHIHARSSSRWDWPSKMSCQRASPTGAPWRRDAVHRSRHEAPRADGSVQRGAGVPLDAAAACIAPAAPVGGGRLRQRDVDYRRALDERARDCD
jgi:ornithine cyclodeaminase/alanine dehydrogenase-like protein (mu-crystallin family)